MAVQQPERAAEQVDAGGDHGGAHSVVVEDERLDEIIDVALVVRGVDDAPALANGILRAFDVLLPAVYLAEDRIERVLQGAVERIPLRGPQLVQVGVNALCDLMRRLSLATLEVACDLLP